MNLGPYRSTIGYDEVTAPALEWTRWLAGGMVVAGAVAATPIVWGLLVDTHCSRHTIAAHPLEALVLGSLVGAFSAGGLGLWRGLVRWVRKAVRLRSPLARFGVALLVTAPAAAALGGDVLLSMHFYFRYLFLICFDGAFFSFGC